MRRKILGLSIGLLLLLLLLEIAIRAGSSLFFYFQDQKNSGQAASVAAQKTVTILALGESTTAVAANPENTLLVQNTAYPFLLEQILNERALSSGSSVVYKVINKGVMGGDTGKVLFELQRYLKDSRADIVVAMMGMKDIQKTQSAADGPLVKFKTALQEVLGYSSIYHLVQLAHDQYLIRSLNIDDSKVVERYEDLSSELLAENVRDVYLDVYNHLPSIHITDEQLQATLKNNLLANYFLRTGNLSKAESLLLKSIGETGLGSFLLANLYTRASQTNKSEEVLNKFLRKHPDNPHGYKELVALHLVGKNIKAAERVLKNAQNKSNKLASDHALLIAQALIEKERQNFEKSSRLLEETCFIKKEPADKRAITSITDVREKIKKLGARNSYGECVYLLNELYYHTKKYQKAEKNLISFLKYDAKAFSSVDLLRRVYEAQGMPEKGLELVRRMSTRNKRLGEYFALADLYKSTHRLTEMNNLFKSVQLDFIQTRKNFEAIEKLTRQAGAKLVLMQYPTFSLDFLKSFTRNLKDVHYVSNETIFNDAPKSSYFFEPRFPYHFNHYTAIGAHIIAHNLANEIEQIQAGRP